MNFGQSISTCMGKYGTFKGRASRSEYWWFYLFTALMSSGSTGFASAMFSFGDPMVDIFSSIVSLALFVPSIAAGSRRLHDIGKSGWWQLLWIIPIIGWIPLIIWLATETKPEENKYNQGVALPKWIKFFLIPALASIFSILLFLGALIITGVIPDTKVVEGSKLNSSTKVELINHRILREEDKIIYFYSTEIFSFTNEGQLITENAVISYQKNEEGIINTWEMNFNEIDRVEQVQEGHILEDSVYKIYGNSKAEYDWIEIWLSSEDNGDKKFVNYIKKRLE
jgi:uncharacterized membrane protein YhaH (DUF805 family)